MVSYPREKKRWETESMMIMVPSHCLWSSHLFLATSKSFNRHADHFVLNHQVPPKHVFFTKTSGSFIPCRHYPFHETPLVSVLHPSPVLSSWNTNGLNLFTSHQYPLHETPAVWIVRPLPVFSPWNTSGLNSWPLTSILFMKHQWSQCHESHQWS